MTTWTAENTEGFTADELAALNTAQVQLEAASVADEKSIADMLNNVFCPGMSADDLTAAVRERFAA